MKNPVWLLIMSFSLLLLAGCGDNKPAAGSESIQSKSAGKYVSSSWHNDTVAQFLVKPTGELSGYLLVNNGSLFEMIGTVGETGILTLSIKDPSTGQPVPGTTSLGTSDGAGTLAGTTYASPDNPFQYVLTRVGVGTNRFYGFFTGPLMKVDSRIIGTCWLGVDYNGKISGYARGLSSGGMDSLTGEVNGATGEVTATTLPGAQETIIITGTIATDGSITNGTWRNSAASGSFSAERVPVL